MTTIALQRKRKNIDLPIETLQTLSIVAASQGKSVKAFIENLLIARAGAVKISISPERKNNPSPSGDPWFDNPENMASVMRGIEETKQGKTKTYTIDDVRNLLGA
jgi:hypothetical protein